MSTVVKPSRRAMQLQLFQLSRQEPNWESMPPEIRQQVERLLARMLREYAARHLDAASLGDSNE